MNTLARSLALALLGLFAIAPAGAAEAEPFDRLDCLRYAFHPAYPVDALLFGTDRGQTMPVPMVICLARRGGDLVLLDSGYTTVEVGAAFGAQGYTDYTELLGEVGVRPADIDLVTLSHLHFDHGGGTDAFPNARFVVQRRELEYAAGGMTHNAHARQGFRAEDVVALVKLNWAGRVVLVDGDQEDVIPGLDAYLTPGHTVGTMTVCLDTTRGRVCFASDAVYTYRNLEQDIALGFGVGLLESVDSYKKIRRLVGGGILIPGHEDRMFSDPKSLGFRRVSDRVVAIVE
jgi:N-acyl homoserine lactone hydrolase